MRRCLPYALSMMLLILPTAASAQSRTDTGTAPAAVQAATTAPAPARDAGPFAKGRKRLGLYAGLGSNFSNDYVIVGAGLGYYVANGLEAGVDYEAWLGDSPSIQKVTPQLRYVFWQADPVKPYLGAFWRHTWLGSDWPNYDSWGGRAGIAYRSGRSYLAVGAVYERYLDNDRIDFADDSDIYPEISFWISF